MLRKSRVLLGSCASGNQCSRVHPLVVDQHVEVEVDFLVHRDFEFFAGEAADVANFARALADEHPLVAVVGREDDGFDVDEGRAGVAGAVFDLLDFHRGRVRDFVVGLEIEFFADEFSDPEFMGDVGGLAG